MGNPVLKSSIKNKKKLFLIYDILFKAIGPRGWWPARTKFEVIVGAILTQNTGWRNVEKAIRNLKKERALSPKKIKSMPQDNLAELIRPSGYYNQKAKRLKIFVDFFEREYNFSFKRMQDGGISTLRLKLLGLNGIGEETADSILLYALDKPIFVVDLYTKRILSRHGFLPFESSYYVVQNYFMDRLPKDVALYNEFHALLVYVGNNFCRSKPRCDGCPLEGI